MQRQPILPNAYTRLSQLRQRNWITVIVLMMCLTANAWGYQGPDPDQGGIGGTGSIDEPPTDTRPEIIDRPERPERIEHIERPDFESANPTTIILDDIGNDRGNDDATDRPD